MLGKLNIRESKIINCLKREPMPIGKISVMTGIHYYLVESALLDLKGLGEVEIIKEGRKTIYKLKEKGGLDGTRTRKTAKRVN